MAIQRLTVEHRGLCLALIWLLAVSGIAMLAAAHDKRIAGKNGRRRVPERTLILLAVLGGSLATYVSMRALRHKTLHNKFMIGLPFIIIFQASIAVLICCRFYRYI